MNFLIRVLDLIICDNNWIRNKGTGENDNEKSKSRNWN